MKENVDPDQLAVALFLIRIHTFCNSLFVLLLYVPNQQLWSWRDSQFKSEQAVNQYFVHILSLETDNNPS